MQVLTENYWKTLGFEGSGIVRCGVIVLIVLAAITCCSCTGGNPSPQVQTPTNPQTGTPGSAIPQLPAPSELLTEPGNQRKASFVEEDLIKHGSEIDPALPPQKTNVNGNSIEFAPIWAEGSSSSADLAYCMYRFAVADYDREAEVRYVWSEAPIDIGTAWLGIGNFDKDKWDWYQADPSGLTNLSGMSSYISGTDELLLVVVQASEDTPALQVIRLGPHPLSAVIRALPSQGLAPLGINFDRLGSAYVGSIVNHEWDWDNDGTYDQVTDGTSQASHTYSDGGTHTAGLRLTDEYGISGTATVEITAYEPWEAFWSSFGYSSNSAVCTNGADAVYVCGRSDFQGDFVPHLRVQKYSLEGEPQWSRFWHGGGTETAKDVAADPAGGVFCVGNTDSFGVGGNDALIQKWDVDGNLVWSKVWGGPNDEYASAAIVFRDNLYIAGNTTSFGVAETDVFLLKYGLDGTFQWARTLGGEFLDVAKDMVGSYDFFPKTTAIHIAGWTDSFAGSGRSVLQIKLSDSGDLMEFQTWHGEASQEGLGIVNKGSLFPSVYITGVVETFDSLEALLLEVGTGPGLLAKTWGGNLTDQANAVAWDGEAFILAGYSGSFNGSYKSGFLTKITPEGGVMGAEVFSEIRDVTFEDVCLFPNSGSVAVGKIEVSAGAWEPVVGTIANTTGTWVTQTVSAVQQTGTETPASGTVVETSDAGALDKALVVAH